MNEGDAMSANKRPDWNLCVRPREGNYRWQKVGVAWTSDAGNISIRLDRDAEPPDWASCVVMLFPAREAEERPARPVAKWSAKPPANPFKSEIAPHENEGDAPSWL